MQRFALVFSLNIQLSYTNSDDKFGKNNIKSSHPLTVITKQTCFLLCVVEPHSYLSSCIPFILHFPKPSNTINQ